MLTKVINRGIRISLMIAGLAIASAMNTTSHAEETPPPIFEDVIIGHKFSPDPLTVRGMSGGAVPGREVAGRGETPTGSCTGYFDEEPDHTIELTSKFDYLKIQVESPEDTTLIVSGPGGSWCNDDFDGKNAGMIGEWLPGTYDVWIGSYKKDSYLPYTLKITEVK
ncbi:hypothetical protein [Mastigocladopsis repens]|uniref:hypothetical protein n=1 Tax=Mastigocladopsis repens TaxID=221287 RepID=UPI0004753F53|nr:hypothetical protein [Mastigocladopsis repens]